jgi:hypothetical protein
MGESKEPTENKSKDVTIGQDMTLIQTQEEKRMWAEIDRTKKKYRQDKKKSNFPRRHSKKLRMEVGKSERRKMVDQGHEQGRPGGIEQRKRKEGKDQQSTEEEKDQRQRHRGGRQDGCARGGKNPQTGRVCTVKLENSQCRLKTQAQTQFLYQRHVVMAHSCQCSSEYILATELRKDK